MRRPPWRGAALAPALAACQGPQTALDPRGPEAGMLADLTWLLFAGGTAIFVLTMLALLFALAGGHWVRGLLGSRMAVLAGGVAFPVVVLTALLVHAFALGRTLTAPPAAPPLVVEVVGWQYWWEVRYPEAGVVTANEIHLPLGRPVELRVRSADVIHSLWIPGLHGKIDMIPGRENRLRLTAGRAGTLRGQCAEFCGAQHALMALYVVIGPEDEFARWLDRMRAPVAPPVDPFLAEGMALFGTAGCGGCHAVRGTGWTGRTGPDLTLVGARLSLGAGWLANHPGTLGGWIAGNQDLKPGNAMPSFAAVLEGRELRAVSAWLASLR